VESRCVWARPGKDGCSHDNSGNRTEKTEKVVKTGKSDSINVSEEAKSKAEVYNAIEIAKNSSEIRWSKVEEVKRKLQDPAYLSDRVIEETAEKILEQFKI
jgi:negative regulator of flagellin synthesis FlgM